jgi:hypothetical protein
MATDLIFSLLQDKVAEHEQQVTVWVRCCKNLSRTLLLRASPPFRRCLRAVCVECIYAGTAHRRASA